MIELHLTRGDNQEGVRLRFPTTPAEIGEAFALLDTVSRYAGDDRILDVKSPVANIGQYVRYADLNSREDMQKLNTLAERIGGMSKRQRDIFAGALDARVCRMVYIIVQRGGAVQKRIRRAASGT